MVTLRDRRAFGGAEQIDAYLDDRCVGTVEFSNVEDTLHIIYMRGPGEDMLRALVAFLHPIFVDGGVRSRASYLAAERAFGIPIAIEKNGTPVIRDDALAYLPPYITTSDGLGVDNYEEIYLKFRVG